MPELPTHEPAHPDHGPGAPAPLTRSVARVQRAKRVLLGIAAAAFIMGFLVGPQLLHELDRFGDSRPDATQRKLKRYLFEAYPTWRAQHPGETCPAGLADLDPYMNNDDVNDAWGQPLTLLCGPTLPRGATGVAIISNGPDQRAHTVDDVLLWQR